MRSGQRVAIQYEGFAMQCMKMLVDEEAMDSPGKVYTAFQYQALHHCAMHQMFQNKSSIYLTLVLVMKHS